MTVFIDPPDWPGHGRLWSHLMGDVSLSELHEFASRLGSPTRAFDRDHYDVPAEHYRTAVGLGAVEVDTRELVHRLHSSGLRRRRRLPQPPAGGGGGAVGG
ncbi:MULTISPECIES: DUF4031 domain-containing protein [unclassified Streptomyces]|uniref:DUF4031 domain-containing protein n=1 Tax=unclassified Streptomyces TaxID=2593676 RepID=UPI000CD57727|nr:MULTISPECIES: DUF4031 domain-containing protein [unclassified Streptomyces]